MKAYRNCRHFRFRMDFFFFFSFLLLFNSSTRRLIRLNHIYIYCFLSYSLIAAKERRRYKSFYAEHTRPYNYCWADILRIDRGGGGDACCKNTINDVVTAENIVLKRRRELFRARNRFYSGVHIAYAPMQQCRKYALGRRDTWEE